MSGRRRLSAALMAAEVASLAVMSALHLSGGLGPTVHRPSAAGIAEAVIAVVLAAGLAALLATAGRGRRAAMGAVGFAILGFVVGLGFTIGGSSVVDVTYHATVLPILVVTLALLATAELERRSA
ncbi:MAG TPA: hypothetical protein VFQ71_10700 [Gaiellales bacterium]|nr:hypothetical protein [Gaiellales bacterium]